MRPALDRSRARRLPAGPAPIITTSGAGEEVGAVMANASALAKRRSLLAFDSAAVLFWCNRCSEEGGERAGQGQWDALIKVFPKIFIRG